MSTASAVNPTQCPLCGALNQCAMELEKASGVKQSPCWCSQTGFDAALLSRIPEAARGKACICPACAQGGIRGAATEVPC